MRGWRSIALIGFGIATVTVGCGVTALVLWARFAAPPKHNLTISSTTSAGTIRVLADQSGKLTAMVPAGSGPLPPGMRLHSSVHVRVDMVAERTQFGAGTKLEPPIPWRRRFTTVCNDHTMAMSGGTSSTVNNATLDREVVDAISANKEAVARIRKYAPWPPGERTEFARDGIRYLTYRFVRREQRWFAGGAAGLAIVGGVMLFLGIRRSRSRHSCAMCGYDLRGLQRDRCPECGSATNAGCTTVPSLTSPSESPPSGSPGPSP
jgi:hypothetical protein